MFNLKRKIFIFLLMVPSLSFTVNFYDLNSYIHLRLSDTQYLIIGLEQPLADIKLTTQTPLFYSEHGTIYFLEYHAIGRLLESILDTTFQASEMRLRLHPCLIKGLGYSMNECIYHQAPLFTEEYCGYTEWIGYRYSLCMGHFCGWIYNNDLGEIIFELTTVFMGELLGSHPDESTCDLSKCNYDIHDYEEYMNNYRPLRSILLSEDIAINLYTDAYYFYRKIKNNEKKKIFTCNTELKS